VEVRTGQCFGEKPRLAMERRVLVSSLASGSRRPVALERTAGRRGRELEENNGKSAGTARSVTKNNSAGRGPGRQRETARNPSHPTARHGAAQVARKTGLSAALPHQAAPPLLVLPLPSANPTLFMPASASAPAESMARAALRLGARALALLVVLVSGAPASLSAVSSARLNSALRLLPPC